MHVLEVMNSVGSGDSNGSNMIIVVGTIDGIFIGTCVGNWLITECVHFVGVNNEYIVGAKDGSSDGTNSGNCDGAVEIPLDGTLEANTYISSLW
jgi:hypothetical protein